MITQNIYTRKLLPTDDITITREVVNGLIDQFNMLIDSNRLNANAISITSQVSDSNTVRNTTSASDVDITNMSITITPLITVDVLVYWFSDISNGSADTNCRLALVVDGVTADFSIATPHVASTNGDSGKAGSVYYTSLAAGSHIIKLQFSAPNGGTTYVRKQHLVITQLKK